MTEFPAGFFDRADESPDAEFYALDRLVTHIDAGAIAAVGELYRELRLAGDVLDVCSSWVSHFDPAPERLTVMGMNANELAANRAASESLIHDLNVDPTLPFPDGSFDAVTCCVSVDYLTRPVEVFHEVARVLRPGAPFVVTFSNRCFPSKAIRGWLGADDRGRCTIVAVYFAAVRRFGEPTVQLRNPGAFGDPLYAVWAHTLPAGISIRPASSGDHGLIVESFLAAIPAPPEAPQPPRTLVDDPGDLGHHAGFGTQPGDVGRIAEAPSGHPIGAAWVRRIEGHGSVDDDTPELSIWVDAAYRGVGVGSALLESLLAAVPRCSISVDTRSPAMRLYQHFGFDVVRIDGDHTAIMLRDPIGGAS